jgi:hypothetical protein
VKSPGAALSFSMAGMALSLVHGVAWRQRRTGDLFNPIVPDCTCFQQLP